MGLLIINLMMIVLSPMARTALLLASTARNFLLNILRHFIWLILKLVYIASRGLWKRYCHFPKQYWINCDSMIDFDLNYNLGLWWFNYLKECQLLKNWERGNWKVSTLPYPHRIYSFTIVHLNDCINNDGRHFLFSTDNIQKTTVHVYNINCEPVYLTTFEIQDLRDLFNYRSRNNVFHIDNGKLFVVRKNLIEIYGIGKFKLIRNIICDLSEDSVFNNDLLKDMHVHIVGGYIIAHEYLYSGLPLIHVWNSDTGRKLQEFSVIFEEQETPERVYVQSKLSPKRDKILINASAHFDNENTEVQLITFNVQQGNFSVVGYYPKPIPFFDWCSPSLIIYYYRYSKHLLRFRIIRTDNTVLKTFYQRIEEYEIEPKICVMGTDLVISLKEKTVVLDFNTFKAKKLRFKKRTGQLYFINPKFVIFTPNYGRRVYELWDIKKNVLVKTIARINLNQIKWHCGSNFVPSKLVILRNNVVYILSFMP